MCYWGYFYLISYENVKFFKVFNLSSSSTEISFSIMMRDKMF